MINNKITSNTKIEDFPEIISIDDIATYLNVRKSIANSLIVDKVIPSIKVGKKMVRIKTKDFREYLDNN